MTNIHPSAMINRKAKIGESISLRPNVIIVDDTGIGNDYSIRTFASIYNSKWILKYKSSQN